MKAGEIARTSVKNYGTGNKAHVKGFTFEVEGFDDLIADFMKLGENAVFKLSAPSVEAAGIVLEKARSKINDIPGDGKDLRQSLRITRPGRRRKQQYRIFAKVGFGKGAMYGVPLELGHKLVKNNKTVGAVKERPFLRPAADESKTQVVSIMVDAMNKIISQELGDK